MSIKPAGLENFGKATQNICDSVAMYNRAHPSDYGQKIPTAKTFSEFGDPNEVITGPKAVKVCLLRTHNEERIRRAKVVARRKLKKESKKLCKKLGVKYQ